VNVYPEIMDKVQFELSPKPSKQQKAAQGKAGFVPVKARWVVDVPMLGLNAVRQRRHGF